MTERDDKAVEKVIEFSFVVKCTKDQADSLLDHLEESYGLMSMPSWKEVEEEELEDGS